MAYGKHVPSGSRTARKACPGNPQNDLCGLLARDCGVSPNPRLRETRMICRINLRITVFYGFSASLRPVRQPPLVNRRSSVNRLTG
jgi:hypothetical protein